MFAAIAKAVTALKSIAVGLGITGRAMFQEQSTVIYPMQGVGNLADYRGHIELVGSDADPARPRCIGCGTCMDLCPSSCITVTTALAPAELKSNDFERAELYMGKLAPRAQFDIMVGEREPAGFVLDYSMCSLCGQCVRNCPAGAIRFSNHACFLSRDRADFRLDLKERLKRQAAEAAGGRS